MIYGWCLSRLIHFVVALRLEFSNERILIAKCDFLDAYRRVAHSAAEDQIRLSASTEKNWKTLYFG